MNDALSSDRIRQAFNGKVNIYTYDQLKKMKSIDQVLGKEGKAIILYFWESNPSKYGHWVCIFKTPRNTVEFFDSYGTIPDKTLANIPHTFKMMNGEEYPHLTKLLYESPYQVEYNDKVLQADTSSVCGRWVTLRLMSDYLPIETFQKLFTKNKKRNDKLVVELTDEI